MTLLRTQPLPTVPDYATRSKAAPEDARRRVLFVGHSGLQGGAELCLETTIAHLDRTRYEAHLVLGSPGPVADRLRPQVATCQIRSLCWWMCFEWGSWYVKNLLGRSLANARALACLIRDHAIDAVYSNSAVIFEGALAARICHVPHLWHVHEVLTTNHMRPRLAPLRWIEGAIDRFSDRVIFESESARRVAQARIPLAKSVAIHNSVRFRPTLPADQAAAKRALGYAEHDLLVAYLGRFSERKNPMAFIRAAERMNRPGIQFLLVGDGPLTEALGTAIAQRRLADRVRVDPFIANVEPVLAALDILVLPSREESFGLVLAEAAAYGKPAIATRTQGPGEIVADGQTGILVEVEDDAALASAMDRLASDRSLRERMGAAARQRADRLFSADRNTRHIEAEIEAAITKRAQSAGGRK